MGDDEYTTDDLIEDLAMMVKAGLLEVRIREDGQWLYGVSEAAMNMTDEEREEAIRRMVEDES